MSTIADDLLRLRVSADAEVGRRWKRRGTAIVLLSLLAVSLAVPALAPIAALPATSWVLSYLPYPDGNVPGDVADVTPLPDGSGAVVAAWTVGGQAKTYLLMRIEVRTTLDVVPDAAVIARWKIEPPGVTVTQTARDTDTSPEWEASSTDDVMGTDYRGTLMVGPSQQCASRTIVGAVGSYCVFTAAIDLGSTAPLPDTLLLVDVASGAPMFEVLLERDAYRIDPCQINGCGTLTAGP